MDNGGVRALLYIPLCIKIQLLKVFISNRTGKALQMDTSEIASHKELQTSLHTNYVYIYMYIAMNNEHRQISAKAS